MDIISRVGRTGISIMLIPLGVNVSSLSIWHRTLITNNSLDLSFMDPVTGERRINDKLRSTINQPPIEVGYET